MSELQRNEERFWRRSNPVAYGVAISSIIIFGYLLIGFRQQCIGTICETNFQTFWEADPNEIGDTLAGFFSALAFVWIIVTVFLQSIELREQRNEFRQQREATQDMAKAMAAQETIFLDEQRQRKEAEVDTSITALLEELHYVIRRSGIEKAKWKRPAPNQAEPWKKLPPVFIQSRYDDEQALDERLYSQLYSIVEQLRQIKDMCHDSDFIELPEKPLALSVISQKISEILELNAGSTTAMNSRVRKIALSSWGSMITSYLEDKSIWRTKTT